MKIVELSHHIHFGLILQEKAFEVLVFMVSFCLSNSFEVLNYLNSWLSFDFWMKSFVFFRVIVFLKSLKFRQIYMKYHYTQRANYSTSKIKKWKLIVKTDFVRHLTADFRIIDWAEIWTERDPNKTSKSQNKRVTVLQNMWF